MDKRKVIAAYQRGMITIQECGQILGIENVQLSLLIHDSLESQKNEEFKKEPVKG
ncbi:hypothetical protein [Paenibacillus pini]|uniref:Uncharacterized protein n=1 Tax=Paenibacillus pini JCM 16418 TaxID=1236976 RepID=W7YKP4_9BACL|nr:hypothetical protein [Paenibacillus pini]GAF09062.1 hypothetical protein JCM16418_3180 [Paenibacillus pini JCM 16418]